jgi:outer membrane lipoprotein-sorting protein
MRKTVLMLTALCASTAVWGQTAAELLRRVDENDVYATIRYEGEMVIEYQNRRYVKTMRTWARGSGESFLEFTNREDRGTKYLKTSGRLYVYSPDTEEVMLISGHMLKESMMGSDLSYEDTLDNDSLSSRYTPEITGRESFRGRDCHVLRLTALRREESYPTQTLWIDTENGDLLHSEQYALSGAVLKEYSVLRVEVLSGRRFPVETEIRDRMRQGSRTVFRMNNVVLDQPIADSVFSTRNLTR